MNYDLIIKDIETVLSSGNWGKFLEDGLQKDWNCSYKAFYNITNPSNDQARMLELLELLRGELNGIRTFDSLGYDIDGMDEDGFDRDGYNWWNVTRQEEKELIDSLSGCAKKKLLNKTKEKTNDSIYHC